jgi:hypothetical protein
MHKFRPNLLGSMRSKERKYLLLPSSIRGDPHGPASAIDLHTTPSPPFDRPPCAASLACCVTVGFVAATAAGVAALGFLVGADWGEIGRVRMIEIERRWWSPHRLDGDVIQTATVDRIPRKPASGPKHLSRVQSDIFVKIVMASFRIPEL